jgi:hypothetical protein
MTTFRTTFALTLAAVLAGVSLTFASSAGAAPAEQSKQAGRVYYGAIALASDGAFGYSYDFATKRAALDAAQQRCRQRSEYPGTCTKIGWIRNACGAVAVKYDRQGFVSRYKFGWGGTKRAAIAAAKRNFGGTIRTWVCTTRR